MMDFVSGSRTNGQVIGYVATGYGIRAENQVKGDIDRYKVRRRARRDDCSRGCRRSII